MAMGEIYFEPHEVERALRFYRRPDFYELHNETQRTILVGALVWFSDKNMLGEEMSDEARADIVELQRAILNPDYEVTVESPAYRALVNLKPDETIEEPERGVGSFSRDVFDFLVRNNMVVQ